MAISSTIKNPDWDRDLEGEYRVEQGCCGFIVVGHGTCSSTSPSYKAAEETVGRLNAARAAG